MAQTPDSSATAYATADDLTKHYDVRVLCQLASDATVPIDPAGLGSDPNVAEALKAASGQVEAYVFRGGRYGPADLQALTGMSARYLAMLVCHLAYEELRCRRPGLFPKPDDRLKRALDDLTAVAKGEMLFPTLEAEKAGLPEVEEDTGRDIERQNMATLQARRYWGRRGNRLGKFPGG